MVWGDWLSGNLSLTRVKGRLLVCRGLCTGALNTSALVSGAEYCEKLCHGTLVCLLVEWPRADI